MIGQKLRAPDTIKGFELTPMPPLPAFSGIFDLTRKGNQRGEFVVTSEFAPDISA
jgi:hypothetical protein